MNVPSKYVENKWMNGKVLKKEIVNIINIFLIRQNKIGSQQLRNGGMVRTNKQIYFKSTLKNKTEDELEGA